MHGYFPSVMLLGAVDIFPYVMVLEVLVEAADLFYSFYTSSSGTSHFYHLSPIAPAGGGRGGRGCIMYQVFHIDPKKKENQC